MASSVSYISVCIENAASLDLARFALCSTDLVRAVGIPASPKMRMLIVGVAFCNFLEGLSSFLGIYTLVAGLSDQWPNMFGYLMFAAVAPILLAIGQPILYFGRYDAILHDSPTTILLLKVSWIVPVITKIVANIQYIVATVPTVSKADWQSNVLNTQVGATFNAIFLATEAAIVITSDILILWKMRNLAISLRKPFFENIGITRLLRMGVMIIIAVIAAIYQWAIAPFWVVWMGATLPAQSLSVGVSFSVLLDFYEVDMGMFRAPQLTSRSKTNIPIVGLTTNNKATAL